MKPLQQFKEDDWVSWKSTFQGKTMEIVGRVIKVIGPNKYLPKVLAEELIPNFTFVLADPSNISVGRRPGYSYAVLAKDWWSDWPAKKPFLFIPIPSRLKLA